MMTFILFLVGLLAIVCIARYNEDDSLFWKLFVSYVGAFVVASVVSSTVTSSEQNKDTIIHKCPMQAPLNTSGTTCYLVTDDFELATYAQNLRQDPAGKDYICDYNDALVNKVIAKTRDQPYLMFHDTS